MATNAGFGLAPRPGAAAASGLDAGLSRGCALLTLHHARGGEPSSSFMTINSFTVIPAAAHTHRDTVCVC
jgi:hypothetical protein